MAKYIVGGIDIPEPDFIPMRRRHMKTSQLIALLKTTLNTCGDKYVKVKVDMTKAREIDNFYNHKPNNNVKQKSIFQRLFSKEKNEEKQIQKEDVKISYFCINNAIVKIKNAEFELFFDDNLKRNDDVYIPKISELIEQLENAIKNVNDMKIIVNINNNTYCIEDVSFSINGKEVYLVCY